MKDVNRRQYVDGITVVNSTFTVVLILYGKRREQNVCQYMYLCQMQMFEASVMKYA